VASGRTANFHTIGIFESFSGPNSLPCRRSTRRRIEMTGTERDTIKYRTAIPQIAQMLVDEIARVLRKT
jgi:hypothetical protein